MKIVIDMPEHMVNCYKAILDNTDISEVTIQKNIIESIAYSIPLSKVFEDIKAEIENYQEFILCCDGRKGIHIEEALKIIDKYMRGEE